MASPTREDTWLLTLDIDGRSTGIWDKMSGGEIDSEESKYRPGGMGREISLGGAVTIGNITISRYYDWARDHPNIGWYILRVGAGRVTIGVQPLDVNAQPQGRPVVYGGTLKTVNRPDIDSEGTDAALLEFECTIDTVAA